jgi:UDP-N-acetylglucosamine--N-acetylmuramyl-(pentapeptide) pyrophosphoryl-undecaprenol N-acetylglucosamine transferase
MQKLGLDPEALQNAAARARSCGHPDAARDLADLVERISNPAGDMPIGAAQPELPGGGKVAYA